MVPGIDPTNDYAFKRLFGREQNRAILIHWLNAVLQPTPLRAPVTSLEILNPFNDKEGWDDKLSIVDIKARDQNGRQYDIEMELFPDRVFKPRVLYYWAKFHQQQLHEGDDYGALHATIAICLVNGVLFPGESRFHYRFLLREERSGMVFSDHLELHVLELPKFTRSANELAEPLDKWMYFFRYAPLLDAAKLPVALRIPEIERAMEDLVMLSHNELERERYEARLRVARDERSRLAVAREEGWELGDLAGRIRAFQSLLNRPVTPAAELRNLPLAELQQLASVLEADVRAHVKSV